MSGKMIQRMIGSIVVCALLAGCLAGCVIILNPNISERPDVQESGEPVSGANTAEVPPTAPSAGTSPAATTPAGESPAAKTLFRRTVTTSYGDDVNVVVTEYLESGLVARVYSPDDSDDEKFEVLYDFDEHGAPVRMRTNLFDDTETVIEITNTYENGKIVSAQISDILVQGESALDADLSSAGIVFQSMLSTLMSFLQTYEGYRDAEISIRNTEICIRLQNGEVVYSCNVLGDTKVITEITQDSNGHRIVLGTTVYPNSENDMYTTISETDEYGRAVKAGVMVGGQSMIMLIEYEIQPGSDAHRRTEVGHVTGFQIDIDTEYSY